MTDTEDDKTSEYVDTWKWNGHGGLQQVSVSRREYNRDRQQEWSPLTVIAFVGFLLFCLVGIPTIGVLIF